LSAAREGTVPELFELRPEHPVPRPLGLPPGTHLLAVSRQGELAVLTDARWTAFSIFSGMLACLSLGSTAPSAA